MWLGLLAGSADTFDYPRGQRFHKLGYRDLQAAGQPPNVEERQVALAAFNRTNVVGVQAGQLRKLLDRNEAVVS
ncbi:hypothetical protein SAMN05518845_11722 [Variovorax sp. YR750]|nr:hypothetical protein SAMN05518845_11722 [Variovorax sp. YR750]